MTKVQRYKVGFFSDEWGMSSSTPRLIPDDSGFAVKFEDYCKLETELAALKAELREICAAIDDPAGDLTLTAVECIKKLKVENESLKRDAEQWRAYQKRKQDLLDRGFLRSPLREEAELNPAMVQGEQG